MAGQTFYPQSGHLFPDPAVAGEGISDPAFVHMRQLKLYSSVGAGLSRDILVVTPLAIAA